MDEKLDHWVQKTAFNIWSNWHLVRNGGTNVSTMKYFHQQPGWWGGAHSQEMHRSSQYGQQVERNNFSYWCLWSHCGQFYIARWAQNTGVSSAESHWDDRGWSTCPVRTGWGSWAYSAQRLYGFMERDLTAACQGLWGITKTGPASFQRWAGTWTRQPPEVPFSSSVKCLVWIYKERKVKSLKCNLLIHTIK